MIDGRISRLEGFLAYHSSMISLGDCDPQYPAMDYLADRLELSLEQRFWLAFLFSISYSAPTAYYMLNEFPDYENVKESRLAAWWAANKTKTIFQTDRKYVKNNNKVLEMFVSYRKIMGGSQANFFNTMAAGLSPSCAYDKMFEFLLKNLYYFGRFSLFLYLESVQRLTGLRLSPSGLNILDAWATRNGVCRAFSLDSLVEKKASRDDGQNNPKNRALQLRLDALLPMCLANKKIPTDYWSLETTLCAYGKLFAGRRYLGYYIDRQMAEILEMERLVPAGVYWKIFWDFRANFFPTAFLGEASGWRGVRDYKLPEFPTTGYVGDDLLSSGVLYKKKAQTIFDPNAYPDRV